MNLINIRLDCEMIAREIHSPGVKSSGLSIACAIDKVLLA
jgi:hypothetical protein